MTVAALFVRAENHYADLGCDCYDFHRDALTWQGGCPGIFHPPCRGWGQLSHMAKPRPGELELAIWSMQKVRECGGVVEHPFASRLWKASNCQSFGVRDQHGGILVPVYQSWFGHRAPKKSCFYIVGPLPDVPDAFDPPTTTTIEHMGKAERERTPRPLATWLVSVAEACA
jgi:hypothetical protein